MAVMNQEGRNITYPFRGSVGAKMEADGERTLNWGRGQARVGNANLGPSALRTKASLPLEEERQLLALQTR